MTANAIDELREMLTQAANNLADSIPRQLTPGTGSASVTCMRVVAEAQAVVMLRFAALSLLPPDPPPVETSLRIHGTAPTRDAHGRFASHRTPPPPPPE